MTYDLHNADCLALLPTMPDASVDAVVCDPPYELPGGFMGKKWDRTGISFRTDVWRELLRVLKPGGHLLAFGGSRTAHRIAVAIEDAGFEIRDSIVWLYGSGFSKSLNVSKAIDRAAGAEREVLSAQIQHGRSGGLMGKDTWTLHENTAAKQWSGWGSALKPAHEPVIVARKPLAKGLTIAANVLAHGTGAINIDGCRVPSTESTVRDTGTAAIWGSSGRVLGGSENGRFPANVCHDGSDTVLEAFAAFGETKSTDTVRRNGAKGAPNGGNCYGAYNAIDSTGYADSGSPARFFYCAKASRAEREAGMEQSELRRGGAETFSARGRDGVGELRCPTVRNHHPTLKPLALMRYLVRLVTPPGGTVLDPFCGSGTTGVAAIMEGFRFIGIERETDYHAIAAARIAHAIGCTDTEDTADAQPVARRKAPTASTAPLTLNLWGYDTVHTADTQAGAGDHSMKNDILHNHRKRNQTQKGDAT